MRVLLLIIIVSHNSSTIIIISYLGVKDLMVFHHDCFILYYYNYMIMEQDSSESLDGITCLLHILTGLLKNMFTQ